ncbi:hypothetical protein BM221_004990 [Beauveria bassiana]|uniref:Uncharacterized protein n=1 Tax=Beauveria bassiana TaxID=176275 RepID=A0A2N6NMB3_BEABA|nr:hypothetical protein BM221_004990 [Beauveria bassiana]
MVNVRKLAKEQVSSLLVQSRKRRHTTEFYYHCPIEACEDSRLGKWLRDKPNMKRHLELEKFDRLLKKHVHRHLHDHYDKQKDEKASLLD